MGVTEEQTPDPGGLRCQGEGSDVALGTLRNPLPQWLLPGSLEKSKPLPCGGRSPVSPTAFCESTSCVGTTGRSALDLQVSPRAGHRLSARGRLCEHLPHVSHGSEGGPLRPTEQGQRPRLFNHMLLIRDSRMRGLNGGLGLQEACGFMCVSKHILLK